MRAAQMKGAMKFYDEPTSASGGVPFARYTLSCSDGTQLGYLTLGFAADARPVVEDVGELLTAISACLEANRKSQDHL